MLCEDGCNREIYTGSACEQNIQVKYNSQNNVWQMIKLVQNNWNNNYYTCIQVYVNGNIKR